ncbi:SMI1/KNR4 family protein [Paenibacillus oleatilyticus]|uniref:SMI1/KNR4 family protein n=1 Tax=Paenibacillus oleatilyticus TaxID=2594886 RepID=UPI001C1FE517|nr:SMI1/KNR4 family protein [Paenibacillus oleatilyticus]MBU7319157.1 hypothetical protein [Paenibacillus oleatilyticus]
MDYITIINNFRLSLERNGMDSHEVKIAFREADLVDLNYLRDLYGTYSKSSSFYNEEDLKDLKKYVIPESVVDFYRVFEPNHIPLLSGGIGLMALESIKMENSSASSSMYLIKYGLLTIATTIGGHVICLDLNTTNHNQPRVVMAEQSFCSYNEDLDVVECVLVPDEIAENYADDEPIVLSYDLIKQCLPEIAASFHEFLEKLSSESYENIEDDFLII